MQGSSSGREKLRRIGGVGVLVGGVLVGSGLLGLVLDGFGRALEPVLADTYRVQLAVAIMLGLMVGDVWAIATRRLYPIGLRRQTQRMLMFQGRRDSTVNFVYGLDAGLGVTTYRMTSGIWVLAVLILLDLVSAWMVLVYGAAFGLSLLTVVAWPVELAGTSGPDDAAVKRLMRLGNRRRAGQWAYVMLLPVLIGSMWLSG